MTARYANGRLQISLISDRIFSSLYHTVILYDAIMAYPHSYAQFLPCYACPAVPAQILFVLAALVSYCTRCLTCRLAGCLALAAAAFFDVFCNLLVFNVFTCFMMLLSFFVISAHMGYAICPLPVILCIYSLSRGVLLTYTV